MTLGSTEFTINGKEFITPVAPYIKDSRAYFPIVMMVNGVEVSMDVAPEIIKSRTMLPIRFIAEGLNLKLTWDEVTRTVTVR